ncbi:porin [Urechidicola sp. KH5]
MIKYFLTLVLSLSCFSFISAQEKGKSTFGKGLVNFVARDSTFLIKFAPRIQFLATSNWDLEEGNDNASNTSFLIRRARLKFDGYAFSPKLLYKFEFGISKRDMAGITKYSANTARFILDAVIIWNFYKNFELWVGQTKLPGNRERVISSGDMQLVDRSLLNDNFNIDRDIGFQVRHHFKLSEKFVVREIFSLAQGEGRNVVTGNLGGHQYTGRLEFLPFGTFAKKGDYVGSSLQREQTPKLAVGVSYDYNKGAVRNLSNRGIYMETDYGLHETDITTIFVDAMYKYKGFSTMVEYAYRDAKDPVVRNSDGSETGVAVKEGNGFNMHSGYLFPKNWEITGRYSRIDLKEKAISNQYTLGASKYIYGHKLKVQSDLSYLTLGGVSEDVMFRLQFELHF